MLKSIGLVFCVSTALMADVLAPAEVGVEKVVQAFSQMVGRTITTEAQAVRLLGQEGKVLFSAYQALRSTGRLGDSATVNYSELAKSLKQSGTSGLAFVENIVKLSKDGTKTISMNDLVTDSGLPKARPGLDVLAALDRAPTAIRNRFATPTDPADQLIQTDVAELVIAAEEGAKLCADSRQCLQDNLDTLKHFARFGLLGRPASRTFYKDAAYGFKQYRGPQLNTISRNLNRPFASASRLEDIPADIQSCALTGQLGNN